MSDNTHVTKLTDDNFAQSIDKGITLVDFHAEWCGPCQMMSPILDEIAEKFEGKAVVAKIDIDVEQKTAAQFQVSSVPTLILFKDGKEVERLVGLRDAEQIEKFISSAP